MMIENTVEERVTGNIDIVDDYNNAKINRSDMIIHHTGACQSKFFKLTRFLGYYGKYMSVGEQAKAILLDKFD